MSVVVLIGFGSFPDPLRRRATFVKCAASLFRAWRPKSIGEKKRQKQPANDRCAPWCLVRLLLSLNPPTAFHSCSLPSGAHGAWVGCEALPCGGLITFTGGRREAKYQYARRIRSTAFFEGIAGALAAFRVAGLMQPHRLRGLYEKMALALVCPLFALPCRRFSLSRPIERSDSSFERRGWTRGGQIPYRARVSAFARADARPGAIMALKPGQSFAAHTS